HRRISVLGRHGLGGVGLARLTAWTRSTGDRPDRHDARWRNLARARGGPGEDGAARECPRTLWTMMAEVVQFQLPYGHGSLEIVAEADLIAHRGAPPIADETGAVFEALTHPIGTPPLAEIVKPGEQVAIVVNDITRLTRTDLLLPPVIETLNSAGVPDSDIF